MILRKGMHVRVFNGMHRGKTGVVKEVVASRTARTPNRVLVEWDTEFRADKDAPRESWLRWNDLLQPNERKEGDFKVHE